jgi:hypothetical protein
MSAKEVVRQVLESLPDDCSLLDIAQRLYAREGVAAPERDPEARRLDDLREVLRQARMYLEGQPGRP